MKNALAIIAASFVLTLSTFAQLVGIGYNSSTQDNEFYSIDPVSGNTTVLNSFDFASGYWKPTTFTVDHGLGVAYAVSSSGTLYKFSITTGAILGTIPLGTSNLQALHASTGRLVGIGYNSSTQDSEFYSIDPDSGNTTVLNSFDFASGYWKPATFTVDPGLGVAYAVSSNGTLYRFSITTGAILGTIPLGTSNLQALHASTSRLVGIGYNSSTQDNEFYSIDPVSGNTTVLNSFDFTSGYWSDLTFTVDPGLGVAYAVSGNGTLYRFSITTGAILGTIPLGTSSLGAAAVAHITSDDCFSGRHWVARYPGSESLSALAPEFQKKAKAFHKALIAAGASVRIDATYRPAERAYLMAFAWKIARENFDPRNVPSSQEVNPAAGKVPICWVHTNSDGNYDPLASKNAAMEMVNAYRMVHRADPLSRHWTREAVDWKITWRSKFLWIMDPSLRRKVKITGPKIGSSNKRLWSLGAKYGVIKLKSDAPHWSSDGR